VFDELEEMGKDIQEEVMDAGVPVHGAGGDVSKCPYYAATTGEDCGCFGPGLILAAILDFVLVFRRKCVLV